jgi:hypothetical protein
MPMPGDDWLEGGPRLRVEMTRAVTVNATPEVVWAWLAQMGRGAGWYSIERLDNGGKKSARHIVRWIPPPQLGDATAIGYLRHLEPGRELAWWISGGVIWGTTARSVMAFRLTPTGEDRARVVERFTWDAVGLTSWPVLRFFQVVDTIMARRQLLNLKQQVELYGARSEDPQTPESGARDQYQLYHVIYASGEEAGTAGKEEGQRWHRAAIRDGLLPSEQRTTSSTDQSLNEAVAERKR